METLFHWLLGSINVVAQFMTFLTTELPYINMSPLNLLTLNGVTIIIGFLALRLVVGG